MELRGTVSASRVRGKDSWDKELDRVIADLQTGDDDEYGGSTRALIKGGLTVTGHDYWVILEYGSSPRTKNAGPKRGDIQLVLPDDIPSPKRHTKWYPIKPKRRGGRLVYFDRKEGRIVVRKKVYHPGNLARGFIRSTIAQFERACLQALAQLDGDEDTLPTRQEIREVINLYLRLLLKAIREATPVQDSLDADGFINEDGDGSHLRDAWGIQLAL